MNQKRARFTLQVNGQDHAIEVTPMTPLLWVLREQLGLTGSKYACGTGQCGACMVHVDDAAVPSCVIPVSEAVGKRIVTIEGLGSAGLHPVQQAWIHAQVPQCGYCQSGQIMAAVALLRTNPAPTDGQIETAMDRVLCRCGTYQRIRHAIRLAAEQLKTGKSS